MRPAIVLCLLLAILTSSVRADDKPSGVGLELKLVDGGLAVMKVLPGGPAARAGVQKGEWIVAIDGRSTAGLSADDVCELLLGERGSSVTLTVASNGRAPRKLRILRELIEAQEFNDVADGDAAILAAAAAHNRAIVRRGMQEALAGRAQELVGQVLEDLEPLREVIERETEFMAKVGELTAGERERLKQDGAQAIERRGGLFVNRNNLGNRRVVVKMNGLNAARRVLETPDQAVRLALTPVLKSISPDAWKKFKSARERLDLRQKQANVLIQIAALDEALLLTGEQREKLSNLLSARWTDVWRGPAHDDAAADPVQLCSTAAGAMDLFTIPDVELNDILRPDQVAAFKLIQLPTTLETVLVEPPQAAQGAANQNNGAVEQVLEAGLVRQARLKIVYHGLPPAEERERLQSLLERIVEDTDVHVHLDEAQKQKLLLAGKLDLERHLQQHAAQEDGQPGKIVGRHRTQIAGAKLRLAPIFSDSASVFQKALHSRLSAGQLETLAEAEHQRGLFHRRAVLATVALAVSNHAVLTDVQAEQVEKRLAESVAAPTNALDLAAWRRATLEQLGALRPADFKPLVDDWQWPATREYVEELVVRARALETQPEDRPPAAAPEEALLGIPGAR
jgi:hypothetical protein